MSATTIETIGIVAGSAGALFSLIMMFVQRRQHEDREREQYVRSKQNRPANPTFTPAPPSRSSVHQ